MQIVELKDEVAAQLQETAQQAHISTNDLIEQLLNRYTLEGKEPKTLNDFIGILKDSPTFKGDPVEIQRKMRNEWD